MPQSRQCQKLCDLCTTILTKAFSAVPAHNDALPVHISDVRDTIASPDLDFIRQSGLAGCRLCSEMLRVHFTKICNGFDATTRESEAEDALNAVSSKYSRISIDMVFQEANKYTSFPHYLLIYTHTIVEDEENDGNDNKDDPVKSKNQDAIEKTRFRFQDEDPELDTDAFLQTLFHIMRSDYIPTPFPRNRNNQYAITLTRRLFSRYGIRHLWVDSLCILQDSKEEWAEEAPRMADIYGNCWCNLAATGGGGLSTRPPGMFPSAIQNRAWTDFVKNSPLNRRAWVCQERLLSPRILHFGVDEVFWECSSGRASETFPSGEPSVDTTFSGANETLIRAQGDALDSAETLNSWLEVVNTFTNGALTYASDKLFAIAGMAKHFQSRFGSADYMAGLWRMGLERQLLWRVETSTITKRSKIYRAPSWCWSSIDVGPIWSNWAEQDGEVLIKVIEANVSLAGTDPFGDTNSGLLRLRGRVLVGKVASDATYFPGLRLSIDETLHEIAYHPDENSYPSELVNGTELFCMLVMLKNFENGSDNDDPNENEGDPEDKEHVGDEDVDVRISLQGLVLTPTNVTHGQYQRIGTFMTNAPHEVQTILQRKSPFLEETRYETFDGHDQYTISII